MKSIVESIERGLHAANYHADLASKRRSLSAWGTVEQRGAGWSWRWSGLGLALPELLPDPVPCVSADAAWMAMDLTVSDYVRLIGAGG
jgi:hypothetical protein